MDCCQQTLNGLTSINTNSLTLDSTALIDNSEFLALDGIDTTQTIQEQIDAIVLTGGQSIYGAWFDTTDQANVDTTNGNYIKCNTTDTAATNGLYVSPTDSTKFYVPSGGTGVYQIQFSVQVLKSTGGTADLYIWLVINGTQVADSAGQIQIQGNNTESIEGWNYQIALSAGDYFQIKWHSDSAAVTLETIAAVSPSPVSPSVILTAFKLTANGAQGDPGAPGAPGTPGLTWRGTYNPLLPYAVGDAVYYLGSSYICTVAQPASGSNPESLVGWNYISLKGLNGTNGSNGTDGVTPVITIGSTSTLSPGSSATVTRTGTTTNPIFSFGIPAGIQGPAGILWQGYWSMETLYNPNDVVCSLCGAAMICIQQAQGNDQQPALDYLNQPPNNEWWDLFANHGAQGIQGEKGDKGDTGDKGNTGDKGDKGDTGPPGGLDPIELGILTATAAAATVSTAKTINILVPPFGLTVLGTTNIDGILLIGGSIEVPEITVPVIFTESITGTNPEAMIEMSAITVLGQSNLDNTGITNATINNLVVIPAGQEFGILTVNNNTRDSNWFDGYDGHSLVKISERRPTGDTEANNYMRVSCQFNLDYTSQVSQTMTYQALGDNYEFATIDPTDRRITYWGGAGLADFIYDSNLRETTWYNDSNLEVVKINTRNIATGGTYDAFSCLAETVTFGSSIGTVETFSCLANTITIGSLEPIAAGNPPVPIIPNVAVTQSVIIDGVTVEIASNTSQLTIGDTATNFILGNNTDTLSVGDTCAFMEVGSDATTLNIANGTTTGTTVTMGANNVGTSLFLQGDTIDIGVRNVGAGFNEVAIGNGSRRTDISIGVNNTGQITNLLGETTNINGSTTNIGTRNTSTGVPNSVNIGAGTNATTVNIGAIADIAQTTNIVQSVNIGVRDTIGTHNVVNIGTGTSATDITIGSVVDQANQITTINGTVNFTGDVNIADGTGGAFNMNIFINQLP